jgi:hypothetical protein
MVEIKGTHRYKDYGSQQVPGFYKVFEKLFDITRPVSILEIGTAGGGTTMALSELLNAIPDHKFRFQTYDVVDKVWGKDPNDFVGVEFHLENIFLDDYSGLLPEKEQEIKDFIQSPGRTIVLCDGANKIKEFQILSEYLKYDDIIMAHDYSVTSSYFRDHIQEKIWNWCEISEKDISDACQKNLLLDFMGVEFQSIAWACKKKWRVQN